MHNVGLKDGDSLFLCLFVLEFSVHNLFNLLRLLVVFDLRLRVERSMLIRDTRVYLKSVTLQLLYPVYKLGLS